MPEFLYQKQQNSLEDILINVYVWTKEKTNVSQTCLKIIYTNLIVLSKKAKLFNLL